MSAPSFDDLYTIGKAELQLKRADLFVAPGDVSDFVIASQAAMADKVAEFAAQEFRKTFIDGATGDDLTTLVDDHFGIQRSIATAATVSITFTRPSAGGGEPAGSISIGTTISTETDEAGERQEYTTDAIATWAFEETGTKIVAATAVVSGSGGNADPATITNIVDAIFDASITVTNAARAAGGNPEETDEELRERARAFPSTLRRGTLAALEFGALTIAAVRVATAIEDATLNVTVFVTDLAGNSTAQMVNDVADELENWRCAGVNVTVTGGTLLAQAIDYSLTVVAGTDVVGLEPLISAAITARLARLPVSDGTATSAGVLHREVIQAAILGVDPAKILAATINTPAADVVPAVGVVLRAGTITRS